MKIETFSRIVRNVTVSLKFIYFLLMEVSMNVEGMYVFVRI